MDKCEEGTKELIQNVINGDLENVKRIVKSGVDIDASEGISRGYYTPAIMAALSGHDHIIDYLASCGADLDKPDVFGHPPIAHAVLTNNISCIMALHAHGASLDFVDLDGKSIIDLCIDSACVDQETTNIVLELYQKNAA
jgi:ankyrin repeat protein